MHLIQKIAAPGAIAESDLGARGDSKSTDTFTWYKSKSRRQIPAGKARVVIWLSQV
jgi:hypothetical protein